jgi:hypothetical protein
MHQISTVIDPYAGLPWEARLAADILSHPVSLQLGKTATDILDAIVQRRQSMLSDTEAHLLRTCSAAAMIAEQAEDSELDPHFANVFQQLLEIARTHIVNPVWARVLCARNGGLS